MNVSTVLSEKQEFTIHENASIRILGYPVHTEEHCWRGVTGVWNTGYH